MKNKIKYCCCGFESKFKENKDIRSESISIEPGKGDNVLFFLNIRSIDKINDKKLNTDFPVSLVTSIGFLFCPWCGCNVKKYYKKTLVAEALEKNR